MGRPIHTNSSIIKSIHVAKLQNIEQRRDEIRRRQFALTLQQEALRKKKQVQDSHKTEAPELRGKKEDKGKHQKRQKRSHRELVDENQGSKEEQYHIDLKID